MKFMFQYAVLLLFIGRLTYAMDSTQQASQNSVNSLSTELSLQLSLSQQAVTKKHIEENRSKFTEYIGSIKKEITPIVKSKISKKIVSSSAAEKALEMAKKIAANTRKKKEDSKQESTKKKEESDSSITKLLEKLEGATLKDIKFLFTYCDEANASHVENAIKNLGSTSDLIHLNEILIEVQQIKTREEVRKQRITLIHKHVARYLGKPNASKEELRKMIKKGEITKDSYFNATTMSIYASFLIEPYLPQDEKK